ncbi:hypothetical protein Q8F55_005430 [Vanrija albida]|uniref:Uncharacterized protein n=1 Tax=Vanrija albida TaxID=181172 RepID=A0ABR3Q256_9TREE
MAKRLAAWNSCLATAVAGNDTLTDLVANSGQVCFAAPGWYTWDQQSNRTLVMVLGIMFGSLFGIIGFFALLHKCCPPKRGTAEKGSEDVEMEAASLLTAVDSEDGEWRGADGKRLSGETLADSKHSKQ